MDGAHDIYSAASHLKRGGVVAFPTETVWGLGACATVSSAVERIYSIKGRPKRVPMALLVRDATMARTCAMEWTADADTLARAFWPGPLTLVVPAGSHLDPIITAHGSTVGLRCPDHPLAQHLVDALEEPIVATSANLSGQPASTDAADVRRVFAHVPADHLLILDNDVPSRGTPSTVYDVIHRRILRQGEITLRAIERALCS